MSEKLRNRLREINNLLVIGVSEKDLIELEKEVNEIFEVLKKEGKDRALKRSSDSLYFKKVSKKGV